MKGFFDRFGPEMQYGILFFLAMAALLIFLLPQVR